MPANLPPQYYVAEQIYRAARAPAEKVAALQQMLTATPKHKGTDHLRADLRAKVARALEELEHPKQGSGQPSPYAIRKEGAGQAALIGLAKSAGFTVAETRQLVRGVSRSTPPGPRWRALAAKKLGEVEERIAEAVRMRSVLEDVMRCECPTFEDCTRAGC